MRICEVKECDKKHHGRGLCKIHYKDFRKARAPECIVEDCEAPGVERRMCHMHYSRWTRHGEVGGAKKFALVGATVEERLDHYSEPQGDCLVWTGKSSGGYPQIKLDGKMKQVYRVAYEINRGSIPEGMEIDHLCRNPACFRVEHLEAVTPQENKRRQGITAEEHYAMIEHNMR